MKIKDALMAGLRGVGRSKRYIMLVYLVSFLAVLIFGASLSDTLQGAMGSSLAGEKMLMSFDGQWYNNFVSKAQGLAATFHPSVVGIGAVLNGLDAFLRGNLAGTYSGIVGIGALYLLLWTLFSAGFISVYAAPEDRPAFLQQAVRFLPRFLGLGILALVCYYLLFHYLLGWLGDFVGERTRETIDERVHFTYTLVKYIIVWFLLWSINLLFDYSKILTVVTDHKNFLTAPLRAAAVILRHPIRSYGLYFLIGAVWLLVFLLYWLVVPGASQSSGTAIFVAFLIGQIYILSRICIRCLFYAGQTAMVAAIVPETAEVAAETAQSEVPVGQAG